MGKKSKYESHVLPRLDEIEAWARDGISDENIACNLSIAYSTFRRYRDENEALSAVLARGKEYVDDVIVTNAYLKRITGYDTTEIKREYKWERNEETGVRVRVLTKETEQVRHIPGDPRAAEFWLANRKSDRWAYRGYSKDKDDDAENSELGVILLPEVKENE